MAARNCFARLSSHFMSPRTVMLPAAPVARQLSNLRGNTSALASSVLTGQFTRQPVAMLATDAQTKPKAKTVNITFIDRDGDEHTVQGKLGSTLLEVAKEYDIDLEGACEGTLSCSTCHLVLEPDWYDKIPDPLTEEEQDMLDLAFGLTDTSRLGCQILVSDVLEGIRLTVPSGTSDARNL